MPDRAHTRFDRALNPISLHLQQVGRRWFEDVFFAIVVRSVGRMDRPRGPGWFADLWSVPRAMSLTPDIPRFERRAITILRGTEQLTAMAADVEIDLNADYYHHPEADRACKERTFAELIGAAQSAANASLEEIRVALSPNTKSSERTRRIIETERLLNAHAAQRRVDESYGRDEVAIETDRESPQ